MIPTRRRGIVTTISDILVELIEGGYLVQMILAIAIWGTALFLVTSGREVPSWLQDGALAILGYFFHVATTLPGGNLPPPPSV